MTKGDSAIVAKTNTKKGNGIAASANGLAFIPLESTELKVKSFINQYLDVKRVAGNLNLDGKWRGKPINVPNCPLEEVRRDDFGVYAHSAPGAGFANGKMVDVRVAWMFSGNLVIWIGNDSPITISTLVIDFRLPEG